MLPEKFIHTVVFEGMPCSGKSELLALFKKRTKGQYLSYENGIIDYMINKKLKFSEGHTLPVKSFCPSLRNTLIVFSQVRPKEIQKRLVRNEKHTFNTMERYDLYNRIKDMLHHTNLNFLVVNNNNESEKALALERVLSFIKNIK